MFWQTTLSAVEAWLQADAVVAPLVTHEQGDTTVVDVAQGFTPAIIAPAIRIIRGPQGRTSGTIFLAGLQGEIPATFTFFVDIHALAGNEPDAESSAAPAWGALGTLEDAVLTSLRKCFGPGRNLSTVLGAPFQLTVESINPVDESYWPAVASRITCVLNQE
jgi:hypothetical protein